MRKTLVLISPLLILIFIGIGVFLWYAQSQSISSVGNTIISARAGEFINKERAGQNTMWTETSFDETQESDVRAEGTTVDQGCFSFTLPFKTTGHMLRENDGKCVFESRVLSPPSRIVITVHKKGSLDEDSGLLMRKKLPDKYKEDTLSSNKYSTIYFFHEEEAVTVFAGDASQVITIALTSLLQPERLKQEKLGELLDSIEIHD